MKYCVALILLYLIAANTGCKTHSDSSTARKVDTNWTTLVIKSEDETVITLNNDSDTTMVKNYNRGSIFVGFHKAKIDSLKAYFTKVEKDSLFYLVDDIVSNPVKPKRACTDFVGDLELTIYYGDGGFGAYKRSITYTGVCDWELLSDKTKRLHKILQKKIKWWSK